MSTVYASREVNVIYLGSVLESLAPDSFVELQLNSDLTDEEVGGDGSVAISVLPDRTGNCTVRLQQDSPSNRILTGMLNLQRSQGSGILSGVLTVSDKNGTILAGMQGVHIKSPPTIGLGSSATGSTRDWVFFCQNVAYMQTEEGDSLGDLAEFFI